MRRKPKSLKQIVVTTVTPIKRGLKDQILTKRARRLRVTTVTPIKRGLKDDLETGSPCVAVFVTTVTPIKRGLKVGYLNDNRSEGRQLQPLPRLKGD